MIVDTKEAVLLIIATVLGLLLADGLLIWLFPAALRSDVPLAPKIFLLAIPTVWLLTVQVILVRAFFIGLRGEVK